MISTDRHRRRLIHAPRQRPVRRCPAEPDPPDEQSEYVDLYLDDGIEVCAGQLAAYDRYVEQVFERWAGEEPPPDFRMRLNALADAEDVLEICGSTSAGCAGHGEAWVSSGSNWYPYHELTHLIIDQLDGRSAPALEEGIADGFSSPTGGHVPFGANMDFLFATSADDFVYSTASLFFRFVSERHGMPAFREY